jgi:NAD(P)-dependent dehydrogenase (short-subunit alcohol dehydrogenase family)
MRSIDAYAGQKLTRLALVMMAHTFPRPGELRLADVREFDLEAATWRIPAARTKMRKEHLIPLSRQTVATMRELQTIAGGEGLVLRSFRKGTPGFAVYGATKAAIRNFVRAWTVELKDRRIRSNILSPGPTETTLQASLPSETIARLVSTIPMGRMGSAEEIAKAALFLASDDSSFVTGIELFVDGGRGQI